LQDRQDLQREVSGELIVLDFNAEVNGLKPGNKLILGLAAECGMLLCYGGGIWTVAQEKQISSLDVEKVVLSSAAVENHELILGIMRESRTTEYDRCT
jgi:cyclase